MSSPDQLARRYAQLKVAFGKLQQDEPIDVSGGTGHAAGQTELSEPADRSMSTAATVTDSLTNLADLWETDVRAHGSYRLLDFDYLPAALSGVIDYWFTAGAVESLDRCAGRRVGMSDVAAIRATVDLFRPLDQKFGGGHARTAAVGYLHRSITPLLMGTYSGKVGRQLFSAIADLTQLVGWMSYDIGQHGLAQRYFAQALQLAAAADDHALGGFILSRMSRQATYLQHPRVAVDLAVAAWEKAAGRAAPAAMALFFSVEARGYGSLGDTRACTAALDRAEQHLAAVTPRAEAAWSLFFDEAQLADEFAHCFRDLGKPQKALHFARLSLKLRSGSQARSRAFCRTVLATAYLQQGELEQACRIGTELVAEMSPIQSVRCAEYIRDFQARLSPYRRERLIREFDNLVRAHLGDGPNPPHNRAISA